MSWFKETISQPVLVDEMFCAFCVFIKINQLLMFTVGDNTLDLLTGTRTVSVLQMCANKNE